MKRIYGICLAFLLAFGVCVFGVLPVQAEEPAGEQTEGQVEEQAEEYEDVFADWESRI